MAAPPAPGERLEYAEFLHDGSQIHFSVDDDGLVRLELPVVQPPVEVPVVKLHLG